MRTTVEITDEHRAELMRLAAQRGEKGFSNLVREAIDLLLQQSSARSDTIRAALSLRGTFTAADGARMEDSIRRLRGRWR